MKTAKYDNPTGKVNPAIAVVTTTHVPEDPIRNDGEQEENYLESVKFMLKCHKYFKAGMDYDLCIIDNDSKNKEWLEMLDEMEEVDILKRENEGFSFGGYLSAYDRRRYYDYYLFHEQDIAPAKDNWLKEIYQVWHENEIGALGAHIEHNKGERAYLEREDVINLDGSFMFISNEILDKCGLPIKNGEGREDGVVNEIRFVQGILESGYAIGGMAEDDRTWFLGSSGLRANIVEPIAETILPLVTIHSRNLHPQMKEYFSQVK